MTKYNVHICREMRLVFGGIDAQSHEAAAAIARDKPTADADDIDDCDGDTFYACVDVQGDEQYEQSRWVDFEPDRERTAAPKLLEALKIAEGFVQWALEHGAETQATSAGLTLIRATIANAETSSIPAQPSGSTLLAALQSVLPYAESEAESLYECWKRDADLQLKDASERCARHIERAHAAIAEANAAGISPARPDIDVHALLAERRQIAAIWSIEDVQQDRPDLGDDDAWQVLQSVEHYHDCNYGITWETLRITADHLFDPSPKTDELQGASHEPR